jgi:hypothetical protein
MNKSEVMTINRSLTPAQRDILVMLDGKIGMLDLPGSYAVTVRNLKKKGLVHYSATARGSVRRSRTTFAVRLSVLGAAFIYNGGIDF